MAQNIVRLPSNYFGEFARARAVFNGSIYVGNIDSDPEIIANRKSVIITQEDGTKVTIAPEGQPLLTGSGGYVSYQGSAVSMTTEGNYSLKVLDKEGRQVYYFPNVLDGEPITNENLGEGIVENSNTTSRSLVEWFDRQAQTYATVAALIAETELNVGDYVIVENYGVDIASGPMFGEIVASGTGTADGGEFIDLTGSLTQFKQHFVNGERTSAKYGASGDGVTDDRTELFNANAAGYFTLTAGTYLVTTNLTISSDIKFNSGAILKPANGVTVTLSGSITAGDYQIFDTSLGGSFQVAEKHSIPEVRITWFGAVNCESYIDTPPELVRAGDSQDQTIADNNMKAIKDAVATSDLGIPYGIYQAPTVRIPSGLYYVDDDDSDFIGVVVPPYCKIVGDGFSSVIALKENAKPMSIFMLNVDDASNIMIDNFQIYGEASYQSTIPTPPTAAVDEHQTAIDVNPASGPIIYSYIGRGMIIKEMKGYGIHVRGQGLDNCTIEPLYVRDSSMHNLLVSACDRLTVQNCIFRTAKAGHSGAVFSGAGALSGIIRNCQFDENNTHGLVIDNINARFEIKGNRASTNATGSGFVFGNCDDIQVSDNFAEANQLSNYHIDTCNTAHISNNYSRSSITGSGFYIDNSDKVQLSNNFSYANDKHGILVDQSDYTQITDNHCQGNQQLGILCATLNNSMISGNYVYANSQETDNTYDGINIQSNSDNNTVTNNTVRHGGGAAQHRYGIRIDDTFSGANLVTNNDLLDSGKTGSFDDNGTGTVTTAGNRL